MSAPGVSRHSGRCVSPCSAIAWPAASISSRSAPVRRTCSPMRKNVAVTPWSRSSSRTLRVASGCGPSSNVRCGPGITSVVSMPSAWASRGTCAAGSGSAYAAAAPAVMATGTRTDAPYDAARAARRRLGVRAAGAAPALRRAPRPERRAVRARGRRPVPAGRDAARRLVAGAAHADEALHAPARVRPRRAGLRGAQRGVPARGWGRWLAGDVRRRAGARRARTRAARGGTRRGARPQRGRAPRAVRGGRGERRRGRGARGAQRPRGRVPSPTSSR